MGTLKNKMKKKAELIVEKLDIPRDTVLDLPKITVISNSEITIENHKGITTFESNEIKVKTSIGVLEILGENFEISFVGGTTIVLNGSFNAIGYKKNE